MTKRSGGSILIDKPFNESIGYGIIFVSLKYVFDLFDQLLGKVFNIKRMCVTLHIPQRLY